MPEEDLDVKDTEESSAEEEELTEEEVEEEETEETKEKSEETEEESEDDKSKEVTVEEDPEKLRLKEQVSNLTKALQEKRLKARESIATPVAPAPVVLDTKTYVEEIVKGEEKKAFDEVYKEYPQYDPANDTDNSHYNQLIQDMVEIAKVRKLVPVNKEQFLDLARTVIAFRGEKSTEVAKAESKGRTEAHKEHLKADEANISTTTSARKEQEPAATEADRRAATAAGQDLKTYLKYKDSWPKVLEED